MLKLHGHGCWDGSWAWGRGQKRSSRNTHVNSSSASWTRAKTPQMLSWMSPYGASGAGSHGDVTHFWDVFQCNWWSSPLSAGVTAGDQRDTAWLLFYCTSRPTRAVGNQNLLPLCTALSFNMRNQRSGSMFPLRSTCASVHPDTQIKVQWKGWNEHQLKGNPPPVLSPTALLLKGKKYTGFVQHILRRFKYKR